MSFSSLKAFSLLLMCVFCVSSLSCRTASVSSELDERVIMSEEISEKDRELLEEYFRDILNSHYAYNLGFADNRWSKELDYLSLYDRFAKKCRLDFHVYQKSTTIRNGLQYYTVNVLVKTIDQPDSDVSRLDSLSIKYFGMPENYEFRYHRGPKSRYYSKIKDTQSSVYFLVRRVMRNNPGCGKL